MPVIDMDKVGTLITFTSVQNVIAETLPASTFPTSEGTAQLSRTVLSTDIPTMSFEPIGYNRDMIMTVGGINDTGSSITVYYATYKNSSAVKSGNTTVSNGDSFGVTQVFGDVSDGDVLEIMMWTSVSNVPFEYTGIWCNMASPFFVNVGEIMLIESYELGDDITPTAPGAWYSIFGTSYPIFYTSPGFYKYFGVSSSTTHMVVSPDETYGMFKSNRGSSNTASTFTSGTYLPSVSGDAALLELKYRKIKL